MHEPTARLVKFQEKCNIIPRQLCIFQTFKALRTIVHNSNCVGEWEQAWRADFLKL